MSPVTLGQTNGRKMPLQKPGRSKQDYATPPDFLTAVQRRYGLIEFDLAGEASNRVVHNHYGLDLDKGEDGCHGNALEEDWSLLPRVAAWKRGPWTEPLLCWLNPPFGKISSWTERCKRFASKDLRILLLVPASIGSRWFAEHVFGHAQVIALAGRLSFDGIAPYPKDCMLCRFPGSGFSVWDWRLDSYGRSP